MREDYASITLRKSGSSWTSLASGAGRCARLDDHRRRWCHNVSGRWFFVDESQPRDIDREYEGDWNVLGSANADSQDLAELRPDLEDVASTGG